MRPEVKRWFKIVFCTLMVVFSVSIGFSDWVYPDNSGDKTSEIKKPNIVAEPCCFIDDNPSKKYVKIEDALKIAKNNTRNDIVYVLPGSNPIIESNCKVEKGDTLCLPYSITKDDKGNTVYNWKKIDNRVAGFADENKTKVDENRKNIVTIKSGITLTVEGTLQIGGEMGSYSAGLAGQTNGNYCEIQMEPKSKISSTGELYCFGYIKETRYIDVETEYNQEAIVDVSGGTVHIPFVIHDFKGGTITVSRFKAGQQSPFEVIDIVNIQSLLRFHNPAIMKAYADLYAGDAHNTTNFNIFSPSNSLLNFSTGSYMESKYINKDYWVTESNGKLYSYTTSYNSGATDNGTEAVAKQFRVHNKISLYGSVSFGTMSMDINPLGVGSVNISTADVYFPVSFRQQIHIYGNLTSNYQIQIMGGCNVYVEEGATFTNYANFLGYGDDVQYIDSVKVKNEDHFIAYHYPKYFIGKGAKIHLKGKYTQSANGFACKVISQSDNAQLDILNASTTTLQTTENGYRNLGNVFDKVGFLAKPGTTVIERITGKGIADVATTSDGLDIINDCDLHIKSSYMGKVNFLYYNVFDYTITLSSTSTQLVGDDGFTFDVTASLADLRMFSVNSDSIKWSQKCNASLLHISLKKISVDANNVLKATISGKISKKDKYTIVVTFDIKDTKGNNHSQSINVVVDASNGACLLPDTMVAMADGSYKRAGDIKVGDMVLSFNHETGKVEASKIILNPETEIPASLYDVVTLKFSDNSEVGVIGNHGFFDMTLDKYVYINKDNYKQYIGHQFYGFKHGTTIPEITTLVAGSVKETFTTICSPVSANNLNIITEDKLGISGEIEGLFNFFDYDPVTLKYDEAKKQADIEKYGLLTYEDYKDLLPYELYEVLPCQYMSVSIGKGLITWDKIKEYINRWSDQLLQ